MTDKDEQDKVLEQKTNQVDPADEIQDDEDLSDELEAMDGLHTQLLGEVDDGDWVTALETAGELQDIINKVHVYISGKIT